MSFLYVVDEKLKDTLLSQGHKILKQETIQDKTVWVFSYIKQMDFNMQDKSKYFISKIMRF